MTHQWLRLWHDMPTDPKWRTISKISGQSIGNVLAVYLHILVNASSRPNATERNRTHNLFAEDIGSAIDIEKHHVEAILEAMQGRVLDGEKVSGWEGRQPIREDGSSLRSKEWREAQKIKKNEESERNRTQPNATERPDKDKNTKENTIKEKLPPIESNFDIFFDQFPKQRRGDRAKAFSAWKKAITKAPVEKLLSSVVEYASSEEVARGYAKGCAAWLNDCRWEVDYKNIAKPAMIKKPDLRQNVRTI